MTRLELQGLCQVIEKGVWSQDEWRYKTFWLVLRIYAYTEIPLQTLLCTTWGSVEWKSARIDTVIKRPTRKNNRHRYYSVPPAILSDMRLFRGQARDTTPKGKSVAKERLYPFAKSGFYSNLATVKKIYTGEVDLKSVKPKSFVRMFASDWQPKRNLDSVDISGA